MLPELPDPEQAPDAADPDLARVRLFDAVGCLLRSAAARRPRLLVIDDLHWADAPSLHLPEIDEQVAVFRDRHLDHTGFAYVYLGATSSRRLGSSTDD